jgi:sugar/nucleoside kinase (ribokinase family)
MQALFIGQTYIDVTFITDHMPTGDEKHVATNYAVSFGGNAVTAAFCCAKLGVVPDLICTVANDWLGRMFWDMSAKYGISVHPRKVNASSLSFIMPKDGKRAIVRCRDDEHIHPFPILNIKGCRALHIDGHQPDAAIHYAKLCRESGILTSLDGGGLRSNTHELLEFIDVAIVAERLCEQMDKTPETMIDYLKSRGCRVGGVTLGEKGLLWYDETGTSAASPRCRSRRSASSTPTAPATSSTAPMSIPISPTPAKAGTTISSSRAPPRPSRSSASATKQACRRWEISKW